MAVRIVVALIGATVAIVATMITIILGGSLTTPTPPLLGPTSTPTMPAVTSPTDCPEGLLPFKNGCADRLTSN
jgi:hypothetical protein